MITLSNNTIDKNDLIALSEWIKTGQKLTYGDKVKEFEKEFAKYVGSQYAVFVNSGSSANLIAIYNAKLLGYNDVILPGLCWATDAAPVYQFGMNLHFIDVSEDNLAIGIKELEDKLESLKKAAILLVDVLGLQPDLSKILSIAEKYDTYIIEDACESLGSTYIGKKLGTFGNVGTYSFYFSHHISTIEGGMVVTDNFDTYKTLLSLRSHGWTREWPESDRRIKADINNINDFDNSFTFYYPGFNVRPTEINAFLGLRQLKKLDNIVKIRSENYSTYESRLKEKMWFPKCKNDKDNIVSSFAIPLIFKNENERNSKIELLTNNKIECRPLIAGNICLHPVSKYYGKQNLKMCSKIHECGMYIPNNENITNEQVHNICDIVGI